MFKSVLVLRILLFLSPKRKTAPYSIVMNHFRFNPPTAPVHSINMKKTYLGKIDSIRV